MRRFLGQFTGPVSFVHTPFWADCITTTFVFRFSVHTALNLLPSIATRFAEQLNAAVGSPQALRILAIVLAEVGYGLEVRD